MGASGCKGVEEAGEKFKVGWQLIHFLETQFEAVFGTLGLSKGSRCGCCHEVSEQPEPRPHRRASQIRAPC